MDSFHPISLCNFVYKIIPKVLTTRLLGILLLLISPQQNGFVPGRQILDSIITIHENIHLLNVSKSQEFLLKHDIAKSYDRADWGFLLKVLVAFGFSNRVIRLIWQLISIVSMVFIVNGSPSHFFKNARGLRQGDPISPILFTIMAESLGRFIQKQVGNGSLKGLKPSSTSLICSHQ